ncbi:fungal hydrophobin-domain-containing protein [Xylaria bambusicola]|uniref:fungal hydrophobin-domain-containing protein n=1 Tax=Xylaria bambusicola TaxID=326684 RepID=UPI0020075B15|nr:fungal hydrophobin-domain-containing protein [Xylaria bambusicola]KAI0520700.1 fungal hydrophobin-domain-containing protein [Xylaria bambusicola]
MQLSILIAAVFTTAVAASPLDLPSPPKKQATYSATPTPTPTPYPPYPGGGAAYDACPNGLFSSAQCCSTDVLGLADLDCASVPAIPTSASEFRSICAASGQRARCCVIPIAGQALLCNTPAGV